MPKQITAAAVAEKIQAGESVYLLDVREPWENEHCRITPSDHIPLGELPQRVDEVQPAPGAMIVVYCHHGVRSLSGAAILEASGVPLAYSMAGGIEAWSLFVDSKVPRY